MKTNKLGTIDDLLSSIRFQRTFLITARLCFSRHLLSDRIDMITFNSPFRKGKVEVVVAWTSSLDFSERSTPLPPFFNRSYTKRGGLSGWTLALNFRRNNKLFRNNCEIRDVAFHSRKQFPRCSNVTRDSFDSLTTPSTLFFSSLPIQIGLDRGFEAEGGGSFSSSTDVVEDVARASAETHPSILRLARACEVGKLLQRRLTSIIITVA